MGLQVPLWIRGDDVKQVNQQSTTVGEESWQKTKKQL